MVIGHGLEAIAPAQVGVHGTALDGAGADERDLHHEVEEAARFEPRQRGQLRAGLHLEDADGIGAAKHVIDRGFGQVELPQAHLATGGGAHGIDHVVQRLQHAETQQVEFHQPGGGAIVLIPLQHGATFHAGPFHRHHVRNRPVT